MMLRARVQQNKVRRREKDEVPWFAKKSTMQATQWMNRTAQGPKWKPESAALRSRLLHAYVYRSFVLPQSTGLSPRCKKWVSKCETKGEKLW